MSRNVGRNSNNHHQRQIGKALETEEIENLENEITIIKQEKNWGKFVNIETGQKITNFERNKQLDCKYIYHDENKGSHFIGQVKNGKFHGQGVLHFKNGTSFHGVWIDGVCQANKTGIKFNDGLEYNENEEDWDYCNPEKNDRRFYIERCHGLKAAGRANEIDTPLEKNGVASPIPPNSFDTGDGYYIPDRRIIYDYNGDILRFTDDDEHYWIIKHCRKGWDEFVGVDSTWRMNNVQERKDYISSVGKLGL